MDIKELNKCDLVQRCDKDIRNSKRLAICLVIIICASLGTIAILAYKHAHNIQTQLNMKVDIILGGSFIILVLASTRLVKEHILYKEYTMRKRVVTVLRTLLREFGQEYAKTTCSRIDKKALETTKAILCAMCDIWTSIKMDHMNNKINQIKQTENTVEHKACDAHEEHAMEKLNEYKANLFDKNNQYNHDFLKKIEDTQHQSKNMTAFIYTVEGMKNFVDDNSMVSTSFAIDKKENNKNCLMQANKLATFIETIMKKTLEAHDEQTESAVTNILDNFPSVQ